MVRRTAAAAALAACLAVNTVQAAPAAPAFRVKLFDRAETVDSREHFGERVIVVRFQASWCKRCVSESAALSRLADRYRQRGVEVLALHVQDTAADVRRFMRTQKPRYAIALDPRLAIGNNFGFKGTPYTVVIDRKGEMVERIHGASAVGRLPKILDTLLAAPNAAAGPRPPHILPPPGR